MSTSVDGISVIIVTHNSLPRLEDCLKALKADNELIAEIIIVDNASNDQTLEKAITLIPEAKIIRNDANLGFSFSCNQAANAATGKKLLFVNPDLTLDTGAIGKLRDAIESNEKTGAVTGRLRFASGGFQPNCRRFPTGSNIIASRGSFLGKWLGTSQKYTLDDFDVTTRVPAVAGALIMIDRALFDSIDGFDERFFMYMEDTDLSYRLEQIGCFNYYVPDAGAVHYWAAGSSVGFFKRKLWHHRSVWKYFLKHHKGLFSLFILPLMLLMNLLLVMLLAGLPGKRKR